MSHRPANSNKRSSSKWLRNSRNIVLASIVLLGLAGSTATKGILAQDKENAGVISGQVTIKGKPGANLAVGLFKDDHSRKEGLITKAETDIEGRFQFSSIRPNHYWVKVLSPNYVASGERYLEQGRHVRLAPGESVDDANWDVIPGGAISGRIVDLDQSPVANEAIHLFPVVGSKPSYESLWFDDRNMKTDETGAYRVYGIPPGQYVIGVGEDSARLTGAVSYRYDLMGPEGRVGRNHYYEQVLYPGVGLREQAHILDVLSESELDGIDFTVSRMRRAYRVSGKVIDEKTGKPVSRCYIQVGHSFGNGGSMSSLGETGSSDVDSSDVDENGHFSFAGFLPGRFFVNAIFRDASDLYGKRVSFEVTDRDVEGLVIYTRRGMTLTGTVAVEGPTPPDALAKRSELKLQISTPVRNQGDFCVYRKATINADGTFKIIGLPPGPVEISFDYCDDCQFFALDRIEYRKVDTKDQIVIAKKGDSGLDRRELNIDRNLQSARIVLRYKSASILCHVNVIGKLPSQVKLMVHINYRIGSGGWSGSSDVDANGDMLEIGLEPGAYDLAIGDGSRRFTKAKRVTVISNQQTKVSFTIDAGEIQRAIGVDR